MKKDWSKWISAITCILLVICLVQIADLKQQMQNLSNNLTHRMSDVENSVQNISSKIYRQLEKEASLLADSAWSYGDVDLDTYTVEFQCSVSPKEYQPEVTKAVLLTGTGEYPMSLENGVYTVKADVPIFEESQVMTVQFHENGVIRTEALDWYLNPRYECLPTAYADFSGGSSFYMEDVIRILDMDGELNINLESKGGKYKAEKFYLLQYIDGKEISREELSMEQESAQCYYLPWQRKFEVPFGCTYAIYVEVVDNLGLRHRIQMEGKTLDEEGEVVEDERDWWLYGEGSLYDAKGNPLYIMN